MSICESRGRSKSFALLCLAFAARFALHLRQIGRSKALLCLAMLGDDNEKGEKGWERGGTGGVGREQRDHLA